MEQFFPSRINLELNQKCDLSDMQAQISFHTVQASYFKCE